MSDDFPKLGIKTLELIAAVETALDEARAHKGDFGAVNWGDLRVTDIEYRFSMLRPDDGPYAVVLVEEASPDCRLREWIYERINPLFPNVHVECEW